MKRSCHEPVRLRFPIFAKKLTKARGPAAGRWWPLHLSWLRRIGDSELALEPSGSVGIFVAILGKTKRSLKAMN